MFSIDSRSRVAIYEHLVQNIIGLIARGVLQPDDQLPSVRSLARDLGINPNTVQKAYQELEAKGMIYQAAGRGSFIAPGESLTDSIVQQKLKEARPPILSAKKAGVPRERILALVDEIYEKE